MQTVRIESAASRGGALLMLTSGGVFLLLLLSLIWLEQLAIWHALAMVAAALGVFGGWAKLAEPAYFIQYDADGVRYQHRYGSWQLPWSSFLYCGVPHYNQQGMAYIGFRVTDYDHFLQLLPPRLAVKIMTEQRALYLEAVRLSCSSGQCASELLAEGEHFSTALRQYNGIKAAFAWRMQRLNSQTGFDVFIPVSLAEPQTQQLCLQINQARLQLIQNTVT